MVKQLGALEEAETKEFYKDSWEWIEMVEVDQVEVESGQGEVKMNHFLKAMLSIEMPWEKGYN